MRPSATRRRVDRTLARVRVGDVELRPDRLPPEALDLVGHGVDVRFRAGAEHDVRAVFCELQRDVSSHAGAHARHERHLAVQQSHRHPWFSSSSGATSAANARI